MNSWREDYMIAIGIALFAVIPWIVLIALLAVPTIRDAGPLRFGEGVVPAYSRDAFGRAWSDIDRNGCDQRNDVLQRDLTNINFVAGSTCFVQSGTLVDPYTNKTQDFVRGIGTSSLVQIDHVYSLSDAWRDGAWEWTPERRLEFANDLDNLVATNGSVNQSKSDKDPLAWSPPLESARCPYVLRYVAVAAEYGLRPPLAELRQLCPLTRR